MPAWDDEAACVGHDPEMWFAEYPSVKVVKRAKAICAKCPIRVECASRGMGEEYGIWGGLTAEERARLRRGSAA